MADSGVKYSTLHCDVHYDPSGSRAIVASYGSGEVILMSRELAQVVERCVSPRGLDGHLEHVTASGYGSRESWQEALAGLVERKILRAYDVGATPAAMPARAALECVTIPTADRPDLLHRCAQSVRSFSCRWSVDPTVIVADASRSEKAAEATLDAFKRVNRSERWRYLGPKEREIARQWSIRRGVDPAVMHWLIPDPPGSYAAGGPRNLALLVTAGRRALTLDDDVELRCRIRTEPINGLAFVGHADPRETTWFETRDQSTQAGSPADVNLLAELATVLGMPLDAPLSYTPPVDTSRACRHMLRSMYGKSKGRVRLCWTGIAGDSAAYCPYGVLFMRGRSRDELRNRAEQAALAFRSREVLRAVPQVTVTDLAGLMLYAAALDNTDILPPFSPTTFNEDGLFGWMLRVCDRSAFVGQVPYAVVHDSVRPSVYDGQSVASADHVRAAEMIEYLCQPWLPSCLVAAPSERMRCLGVFLRTLGELAADEFHQHLLTVVGRLKCAAIAQCEVMERTDVGYPRAWYDALRKYRTALVNSIAAPTSVLPVEWAHLSVELGSQEFQRYLKSFGEALTLWPDIWQDWRSANCELVS